MVSNVSYWIYGTRILQPKFKHHPQESHSSGVHHVQGPSARQAIHTKLGLTTPSSLSIVAKTGSPESQLPSGGYVSSYSCVEASVLHVM